LSWRTQEHLCCFIAGLGVPAGNITNWSRKDFARNRAVLITRLHQLTFDLRSGAPEQVQRFSLRGANSRQSKHLNIDYLLQDYSASDRNRIQVDPRFGCRPLLRNQQRATADSALCTPSAHRLRNESRSCPAPHRDKGVELSAPDPAGAKSTSRRGGLTLGRQPWRSR
jgi:hypothetical protein